MNYLVPLGLTSEQNMLVEVVGAINESFPLDATVDPRAVWEQLVELGVHAMMLEENSEDVSPRDLMLVASALGEGINAETFLWGAVAAPAILRALDDSPAVDDVRARIEAGALATVAMHAPDGAIDAIGSSVAITDGTANGAVAFVPFARASDLVLLIGTSDEGLVVAEVDPAAVTWHDLEPLDLRTPLATGELADVAVRVLGVIETSAVRMLLPVFLAQAAAMTGSAQRALADAVDYSRIREQFGSRISQFQAIRHRLAETLVEVELMRATVWNAARDDADDGEVLLAAYHCLANSATVARANIQVHGGIGFTWEHTAHRHYRYAFAARQAVCSLESLERVIMDQLVGADGTRADA